VIGEPRGAGQQPRILAALDRLADEFSVASRCLLFYGHGPATP